MASGLVARLRIAGPRIRQVGSEIWDAADRPSVVGVVLVSIAAAGWVTFHKVWALQTWNFTSDIFLNEQIVEETLRGNFGLEFSYGNQFGDHAYLILLLFLPFEVLWPNHLIYALLLLGPTSYALTCIVGFMVWRRRVGWWHAAGGWLLLLIPLSGHIGLHELTHGSHLDNVSGFYLVLAAILFAEQRRALQPHRATRYGAVVALALFLSLKEEMALLAVVFFAVRAVVRRSRADALLAAGMVGLFLLLLALIGTQGTHFNRTNARLLAVFFEAAADGRLAAVLTSPQGATFLWTTTAYIVAFGVLAWASHHRDPDAVALVVTGIAKLGLALMVLDPDLGRWHAYPGIIMLSGGVALQTVHGGGWRRWWRLRTGLPVVLAGCLSVGYLRQDARFLRGVRAQNRTQQVNSNLVMPALASLQARIDPAHIVTANGHASFAFRNRFRYAFYPRGVYQSPLGISDYVVLDTAENPCRRVFDPDEERKKLEAQGEFERVASTRYYDLYVRRRLSQESAEQRSAFDRIFPGVLPAALPNR